MNEKGLRAVVFGASGSIGGAMVEEFLADHRFTEVHSVSRHPTSGTDAPHRHCHQADLTDEQSVVSAARQIGAPLHRVIVATGILHDAQHDLEVQPEKSWATLDPNVMQRVLAVNTVGPALVAKHFLPLLDRSSPSTFAALSARVGSIGDNRLGGWYSYRASKAALNMLIKTLAIELKRKNKQAVCIGLHPGTVDSALSEPFQSNVKRLFSPKLAAVQLLQTVEKATVAQSGQLMAYDGSMIEP